jgi:hypothetical protein
MEHYMSAIEVKELSHPAGEVLKIAAGKTLDLHSQGSVTMPAGSVLQVQTFAFTGLSDITTSSTTNIDLPWNCSITKKRSNSKLVCQLKWFYYYTSSNPSYFMLSAYVNGSIITSSNNTGSIWSNGTIDTINGAQWVWKANAHQSSSTQFWDEQDTSVANITFKIRLALADPMTIWSSGIPKLVVTEVAQ